MNRFAICIAALGLAILACSPLTNVLTIQEAPTAVIEIAEIPSEDTAQVESILEETAPLPTLPADSQALPETAETAIPQADGSIADLEPDDSQNLEPVQAQEQPTLTLEPTIAPTEAATDAVVEPTVEAETPTEAPAAAPPADTTSDVQSILQANTQIEPRNPDQLALALNVATEIVYPQPREYALGDTEDFFATNYDTDATFPITASLVGLSDKAYLFVDITTRLPQDRIDSLINTFDASIYPIVTTTFGPAPGPDIDGQERIFILVARDIGNIGGYFGSSDRYTKASNQFSNEKNILVMSNTRLNTLTHEFQHLVHDNVDTNETSWINEGASVLSEWLVLDSMYPASAYYNNSATTQLESWKNGSNDYAAGFLILKYFRDRFGSEMLSAILTDSANSFESFDNVFELLNYPDTLWGETVTTESFILDWFAANFVFDSSLYDGRFSYQDADRMQSLTPPEIHKLTCGTEARSFTAVQISASYHTVDCAPGTYSIEFAANPTTKIINTTLEAGNQVLWSNHIDNSITTATKTFDLTNVTQATLTFDTWYRIEPGWDYAYLLASTNGGQNWNILQTQSSTQFDPQGTNFNWGYNNQSGGNSSWVTETADLTPFVGQEIQIRYLYVTDDALTEAGMLIDNVAIPEINYFADFQTDDHGWDLAGFAPIQNELSQRFAIQIVHERPTETVIERVWIDTTTQTSLDLTILEDETATIIVSPMTRISRFPATYTIQVNEK